LLDGFVPGAMIGLGCMRLSTSPERDHASAIRVIHAALDSGATLLDTADAYCIDDSETGHNERLVAEALGTWPGDRSRIEVATKGGLRRPRGQWVPDGRATHLRAACEASRSALGVNVIDLYQLHAVDPRTSITTSVRALAALQQEGRIRRIGLCNVNVQQIRQARAIAEISAVQVSLSVLDDTNLRGGVAEYCRDEGIRLIAYRPLGGPQVERLSRDPVLTEVARHHRVTPAELALAWLLDLDATVVPVPGATRVAHAESLARVLAIRLRDDDRIRLDAQFPAGRILRVPRSVRQPPADAGANARGEVVIVMGMPAAGKSTVAHEFEMRGHERLNRDSRGGRLRDLVAALDEGLARNHRWVLDNTYATRASRNEIIECAWRHGVPVRCVFLQTRLPEAQVNAITRLIAAHGRLPMPEELRALGRTDHRYFGPDAQFRYERQLEAPLLEEGFTHVETREFSRRISPAASGRALILEFDDVLCSAEDGTAIDPGQVRILEDRKRTLCTFQAQGWHLFAQAWRPQIARGELASESVEACFARIRELLEVPIALACCPHDAGPPICWCRKPLPGLPIAFALAHGVDWTRSIVIGRAAADRTMAENLGAEFRLAAEFFRPPS
jgi:aryl-alcohol dehydrogenase-like predicted oxidoreductase